MAVSRFDTMNVSQFNPLSMEEIWKPSMVLREQHDRLQEEYDQAAILSAQGLSGLNPEQDAAALTAHQTYQQELEKAANDLSSKGFIDSGRRQNLSKLKTMYATQVLPYEKQLAERKRASEMLWERKLADPSYQETFDPSSISLDRGIKDPNAFKFQGVSKSAIEKEVASKAVLIKDYVDKQPEIGRALLPFQRLMKTMQGASFEDIQKALALEVGDQPASALIGALNTIVKDTVGKYNVDEMFSGRSDVIEDIYKAAGSGLIAAIGGPKYSVLTDSYQMNKQLADDAHARQMEELEAKENYKRREAEKGYSIAFAQQPTQNTVDEGKRLSTDLVSKEFSFNKNTGKLEGEVVKDKSIAGMFKGAGATRGGGMSRHVQMKDAGAMKSVIDSARNQLAARNPANKKLSDKQVYEELKSNEQLRAESYKALNHTYYAVKDKNMAENIYNDAFLEMTGNKSFVLYDEYNQSIAGGQSLNATLKNTDITADKVQRYIKDNNIKPSFDATSGMWVYQVPDKMAESKGGTLSPASDSQRYYTIGIATDAEQSARVQQVEAVRNAKYSGATAPVKINKGQLSAVVNEGGQQKRIPYDVYYDPSSGTVNKVAIHKGKQHILESVNSDAYINELNSYTTALDRPGTQGNTYYHSNRKSD